MTDSSEKATRRNAFNASNSVKLTRAWDAMSDEDKARHGAGVQEFCAWISSVLLLPQPMIPGGNVYSFADTLGVDIRTRGRYREKERQEASDALASLEKKVHEQHQLIIMLARVVQGLIPEGRIDWLDKITADGPFAEIEASHMEWAPCQIEAMLARRLNGDEGVALAVMLTPEKVAKLKEEAGASETPEQKH